ncbi:hypothetical protein BKA62DRAFT_643508 [Auriculariales sp. MPI-PUGE-AT-0066]|nr:hypothetical protein BKA62DRAFT_643508 [Auriculariales sp. MPI-PUGE-AT-0066]
MAHRLADELLKDILAPPLLVSDALFCNTDDVSPFSRVDSSASDVLLVCKRWMRVATPCLYETVVIRSTAQAHALRAALTRNPQFGTYVRRFRIENTYATYLNTKIIATMPNIRELVLPIGVMAADRPTDLYALVANPKIEHFLVVNYRSRGSNVTRRKLLSKAIDAVATWKSLKRVTSSENSWKKLGDKFWDALAVCRTLHTVQIACRWLPTQMHYRRILTNVSLKQLVFVTRAYFSPLFGFDMEQWRNATGNDTCCISIKQPLSTLLLSSYAESEARQAGASEVASAVIASPNPFWKPMASADLETRINIWTRILMFGVENAVGHTRFRVRHSSSWINYERVEVNVAQNTVLLSKELSVATIRAVSQHLAPSTGRIMRTFCSMMKRDPALRRVPQTLRMTHVNTDDDLVQAMLELLQELESAVFQGAWMGQLESIKWLTAISPSVGHSLRRLELELPKPTVWTRQTGEVAKGVTLDPIAVFGGLEALQELVWSGEPLYFSEATIPKNMKGLRRLKKLQITKGHQSLFMFLSQIPLPALEEFVLTQAAKRAHKFIQNHGAVIRKFTAPSATTQEYFDSLSQLEELKLSDDNSTQFFSSIRCLSVTKLILMWPTSGSNWIGRYSSSFGFLLARKASFPNLREIWLPGRHIWPTTERDEKKNIWIPHSESLASVNIALKDANGWAWRQRLKIE